MTIVIANVARHARSLCRPLPPVAVWQPFLQLQELVIMCHLRGILVSERI